MANSQAMVCSLTIPVPWGHIAGKAWGQPSGRPVLAVHGWLDNAGSFDNLTPLLSHGLYVVAVDLPGHGQSSHRPRGVMPRFEDDVATIQHIVDALHWERFMILGHSLGGTFATLYAASMPGRVTGLVTIEGIGEDMNTPESLLPTLMGGLLTTYHTPVTRNKPKILSWDQVVSKIHRAHAFLDPHMPREAAIVIASRGTLPFKDGYILTHDPDLPRLTSTPRADGLTNAVFTLMFSEEMYQQFFSILSCPTLIIIAKESGYPPDVLVKRIGYFPKDKTQVVTVVGGHQLHMYNAAAVAKPINAFLHTASTSSISRL